MDEAKLICSSEESPFKINYMITCPALTGYWIVTGMQAEDSKSTIGVYDSETLTLKLLPLNVCYFTFIPFGIDRIVISCTNGSLCIINVNKCIIERELKTLDPALCMVPFTYEDQDMIAMGTVEGDIKLWEPKRGTFTENPFEKPQKCNPVSQLYVVEATLVARRMIDYHLIRVDFEAKIPPVFIKDLYYITPVIILGEEKLIACSRKGMIYIWNLEGEKEASIHLKHKLPVRISIYKSDIFITFEDGESVVWSLKKETVNKIRGLPDLPYECISQHYHIWYGRNTKEIKDDERDTSEVCMDTMKILHKIDSVIIGVSFDDRIHIWQ